MIKFIKKARKTALKSKPSRDPKSGRYSLGSYFHSKLNAKSQETFVVVG